MPRWLLKIFKEETPTASLGNLCQCSITHTVRTCFLMARWNLLCSGLCPLPLVLALGTAEKSLALLFAPSLQVFVHIDEIPP